MATNADITAQISLCTSLGLTTQQIVALCDRAIAEFFLGKPQVSYTIMGRAITFANLQTVQGLRDYYTTAPAPYDRPYISQAAEL